eukprot:Gb_21611 [translate_table: standard]
MEPSCNHPRPTFVFEGSDFYIGSCKSQYLPLVKTFCISSSETKYCKTKEEEEQIAIYTDFEQCDQLTKLLCNSIQSMGGMDIKFGWHIEGIVGAYSEAAVKKAYPHGKVVPCEKFQDANLAAFYLKDSTFWVLKRGEKGAICGTLLNKGVFGFNYSQLDKNSEMIPSLAMHRVDNKDLLVMLNFSVVHLQTTCPLKSGCWRWPWKQLAHFLTLRQLNWKLKHTISSIN